MGTTDYGNGRTCKPGSDDTSVLQLLLDAALARGQLHRLLEVGVDSNGGNVFHQMCFGVKPVQLQTPLVAFCQTTLPMFRLLVEAGADLGPMHRFGDLNDVQTVLDHARRQTSAQARDIVTYLESINAPSNALSSSSSSETSSSETSGSSSEGLNMEDAFV